VVTILSLFSQGTYEKIRERNIKEIDAAFMEMFGRKRQPSKAPGGTKSVAKKTESKGTKPGKLGIAIN
jgi:hypothetical protein